LKEGEIMKLGCRDLRRDCLFVAEGKTADEVKKKIFDYAVKVHP